MDTSTGYRTFFLSLPGVVRVSSLLLLLLTISFVAKAQRQRIEGSEQALGQLKLSKKNLKFDSPPSGSNTAKVLNRTLQLKPNSLGFFNRIPHIKPAGKVPIQIAYPDGNVGEEVVIMVKDGGKLDNGKQVKVVHLDSQRKISFNFQVTDHPGTHRVVLQKGNDMKVLDLWVGSESSMTQN